MRKTLVPPTLKLQSTHGNDGVLRLFKRLSSFDEGAAEEAREALASRQFEEIQPPTIDMPRSQTIDDAALDYYVPFIHDALGWANRKQRVSDFVRSFVIEDGALLSQLTRVDEGLGIRYAEGQYFGRAGQHSGNSLHTVPETEAYAINLDLAFRNGVASTQHAAARSVKEIRAVDLDEAKVNDLVKAQVIADPSLLRVFVGAHWGLRQRYNAGFDYGYFNKRSPTVQQSSAESAQYAENLRRAFQIGTLDGLWAWLLEG